MSFANQAQIMCYSGSTESPAPSQSTTGLYNQPIVALSSKRKLQGSANFFDYTLVIFLWILQADDMLWQNDLFLVSQTISNKVKYH